MQFETRGLQMIEEGRRQRFAFSDAHARVAVQRHRRQSIQTGGEVYRLCTQPETTGTFAGQSGSNDRGAGIATGNAAELNCVQDGRMH